MLEKFLKEVISIVVGKQAEDIVDLLDTKKYVNEFIIAKKLDITINQTRNILYKISDYGLVSSIRKKDKRKGWYTYFWKIEIVKSLEFLRDHLVKKIDQINNQIKSRETKRFYVCERCNIELSEENALLYNFTCNECGDVFSLKDNTKLLRELKKNLDRLNKDLALVEGEITKEKEKIEKKKSRELKKEERAKKKLRRKKRPIKKRKKKLLKKLKKKKTKKIIKRKPKKKLKKPIKKKTKKKQKKIVRKKLRRKLIKKFKPKIKKKKKRR
jgi:transcription factor E